METADGFTRFSKNGTSNDSFQVGILEGLLWALLPTIKQVSKHVSKLNGKTR